MAGEAHGSFLPFLVAAFVLMLPGGISKQLFLALSGRARTGNPLRSPFFKGGDVCGQKAEIKIRVHGKTVFERLIVTGECAC